MAIFQQKGSRRFEMYNDAFDTSEGVRRRADSFWWLLEHPFDVAKGRRLKALMIS